jgi:pSer/pThr/pTyr-binding forkhead associated (FHA) protein
MPSANDKPPRLDRRGPALVVIYGDQLGKVYDLNAASVVIGRSSKCEIRVNQVSISRNHAMLVVNGKSVLIRDLDSSNGTYINDQPIQEQTLRNGDLIKVGRTIFKFLGGDSVERGYHEEMYRQVLANQPPNREPPEMTLTESDGEPRHAPGNGVDKGGPKNGA